jgi:hypothetical protein
MNARSSLPLYAPTVGRRTPLIRVVFGIGALSLVAFPWTLMAVDALPKRPVLTTPGEQPTQTEPEGRSGKLSAVVRSASPGLRAPNPEAATTHRHIGAGLAENSWDFNAPDGVPGFGPLDPADARRVLELLER